MHKSLQEIYSGASFDSVSIMGMQGTMNIKFARDKEKSAMEILQKLRMMC
jgi:hypothetical protein